MKSNYRSWNVNIEDFYKIKEKEERLKFLLNFAVLAPSAHNSQPWDFLLLDNAIEFVINKERTLEKSDPTNRLLLMGFGCLLENILVASDYFGFEATVSYFPRNDESSVFRVNFKEIDKVYERKADHLIFQIPKRHTNRGLYLSKSLPPNFIPSIKELSSTENNRAYLFSEGKLRDKIGQLILESNLEIMDKKDFREELSQYIKPNATSSKIGMPGFTLGLPGLISFFAPLLVKKVNLSRKSVKQDEKLLKKETPAFLVISTNKDTRMDWIAAGVFMQNIWLLAESYGLAISPFASVTQISSFRVELQRVLKLEDFPQIVCRIGYPEKNRGHSPRFRAQDLIKNK